MLGVRRDFADGALLARRRRPWSRTKEKSTPPQSSFTSCQTLQAVKPRRPDQCGQAFYFGGRRARLRWGRYPGVHAPVVLASLLLERNDIREIHRWGSGDGALHEFEPNGKCGACAVFFPERNLFVVEAYPPVGSPTRQRFCFQSIPRCLHKTLGAGGIVSHGVLSALCPIFSSLRPLRRSIK